MSKAFDSIMTGLNEAIEAWEAGTNHPSGAASRLLKMMEMDARVINEFPFVKATAEFIETAPHIL